MTLPTHGKESLSMKEDYLKVFKFPNSSYPTVPLLVEDLWREGNSILRLFFTWDIFSHPFPVVFITCYVHLLKVNLVGLQKAHYFLLFLFDLVRKEEKQNSSFKKKIVF